MKNTLFRETPVLRNQYDVCSTCHKGEQRSVLGNWRVILLFTLSVETLITNCIALSASFRILGNQGTAVRAKIFRCGYMPAGGHD